MKLTLLGTGTSQGVPVVGCQCSVCQSSDSKDKRLRQSAILQSEGTTLLIDTGPDLRQQLLRTNTQHIDAILYTHEHNDHVIGLDDIRPIYFKTEGNVAAYGLDRVFESISKRFSYMFDSSPYPGVAQIDTNTIPDTGNIKFLINSIEVQAIHIMHGKMPILGYRFGNIAYITDASYIDPEQIKLLQGLDYLVLNALHHMDHHSHFNLEQAIAAVESINPKKAYLTHISHFMGLAADVNKQLPAHIQLAYDGLIIET